MVRSEMSLFMLDTLVLSKLLSNMEIARGAELEMSDHLTTACPSVSLRFGACNGPQVNMILWRMTAGKGPIGRDRESVPVALC